MNYRAIISSKNDPEIKYMAVNNTFYFLKVELGIDTCEEVAAVERTKHGPEILWFWIRLALKYANYQGILLKRIGDQVLPVALEDLEAEMKGAFTDVSIKAAFDVLLKGSLIYENSNGFFAITGLYLSGDPAEPTLHKQNSNKTAIRPLSIGNDTKAAQYHRERRRRIAEQERLPMLVSSIGDWKSFAEVAKAARCTKQTVINHMKRRGWENCAVRIGQKSFLPANVALYLELEIKGKKIPAELIQSLTADGLCFDGLDGLQLDGNTVKELSNNHLEFDGEPSNESMENVDDYAVLDSFANANPNATFDANDPLFEEIQNIENKEDDIETVKSEEYYNQLYNVGFDSRPDTMDRILLRRLEKEVPYGILLEALKKSRKYHAGNLSYTEKIIEKLKDGKGNSFTADYQGFNPDRQLDPVVFEELNFRAPHILGVAEQQKQFYTDKELLEATRSMSLFQKWEPKDFIYALQHPNEDLIYVDES